MQKSVRLFVCAALLSAALPLLACRAIGAVYDVVSTVRHDDESAKIAASLVSPGERAAFFQKNRAGLRKWRILS